MSDRSIRIGIDVGGTFTHAVAIDHNTLKIVARACRPTTHTAAEGVALGILQSLEALLAEGSFVADDVVFVAHSTTQATNALLEGDVARVGLIGIIDGTAGIKAKSELSFGNVPISGEKYIPVIQTFSKFADAEKNVLEFIKNEGATTGAYAVAESFAVDNPENEKTVQAFVMEKGCPCTASHEVSGLYGLKARARTSIVNASILPKMIDVSEKTQLAVEKLGIKAPLMIMRSDGGVMSAAGMKKTPIHTILSGPAAGVSASILHEKIANGLFVEVGGTSTDVSLVRDGKPEIRQATIGGNVLYLKTLDVRTVGAAGGSMVRISGGLIKDVGPRSAHIAGLPYACFSNVHEWNDPSIELIAPGPGDPADYAVVVSGDGKRAAITTTCAANAAGLLSDNDYSHGNADSAIAAFSLLAKICSLSHEEAANKVINIAADKVVKLCRDLLKEYPVEIARLTLVGGGGGASVIAPATAKILALDYKRCSDAEVISAIGAGVAMLKNVVEKSVVNPTEDDIKAVRAEAMESIIASGGAPDKIQVEIEVNRQKNIIRAIATGSSTLSASMSSETITAQDAEKIAVDTLSGIEDISLVFEDGATFVFSGIKEKRGLLGLGKKTSHPVVVVDNRGLAVLTLPNAEISTSDRNNYKSTIEEALKRGTIYNDGGAVPPALRIVFSGRVLDLSKLASAPAMIELANMEISEHPAATDFCIIVSK